MNVKAFPWAALDSVRARDAAALGAARRGVGPLFEPDQGLSRALGELLAARVRFATRGSRAYGATRPISNAIMVRLLTAAGEDVRVECEPAMARDVVQRVIKRPDGGVVDPHKGAGPSAAGVVAAVLLSALRRTSGQGVLLASAGSAPGTGLAAPSDWTTVSLHVTVDDAAYTAHVSWDGGRAPGAEAEPFGSASLRSLGVMPLALEIVAATSSSTVGEIETLRRGDAWMPGEWRLDSRASLGPVALVAPESETGVTGALVEGGGLVLRGEPVGLPWTPTEDAMSNEATVEALSDAPVVVRVEIGTAQMLAREWAELRAGDVVKLGRKLGEPVVLRAGGVEIARGELVQIDGEVGVRIAERR